MPSSPPIRRRVANAGVSGDTTGDAARRLPRALAGLDARPALAIVQAGPNDVLQQVPPASTRAQLDVTLIVTARHHPVRLADLIRDRVTRTPAVADPDAALEAIVATIAGIVAGLSRTLGAQVQTAEDRLLEEADTPTTRELTGIRRRLAQLPG